MAKIKEIYSNDNYYPFIVYCENHGYTEMKDLAKCQFHKLQFESDMSAMLISKIKTIYFTYFRTHTSEFIPSRKPAQKSEKAAFDSEALSSKLKEYFKSNKDKLIHITDLVKLIGKSVKRNDILKVLNEVAWCKAVDDTTFFYAE